MAEPLYGALREAWKAGAGLFDLFGEEPVKIKEPVGPDAPNRRPDVAKVETFLDRAGHLDLARTEGPTGYYGSPRSTRNQFKPRSHSGNHPESSGSF